MTPKKRDDGEGSVYQLQDGRWRADVTLGWERLPGGKKRRIRKVVYGRTEQDAKAERRELLAKREQGQLPIGDRVTLGQWMNYWLDEIAVHRITPKTMESYRGLTDNWIIPTIGDVRLRALAPEHVEQLHNAMRKGRDRTQTLKNGTVKRWPAVPLSQSTVLQAHHILSRALKVAMQRGKLTRNVATLIDAPVVPSVRVEQYLTLAEAKRFLAAVVDRWNGARWTVGLAVGLRQGEALGLLWENVHLDEGYFEVEWQLQRRRGGGTLELVRPKTAASRRRVLLSPPMVTTLRAHRKAQVANRLALGTDWRGTPLGDLVFTTRVGTGIESSADWKEWKDLLESLSIDHIRQHATRHTAATLMLLQGVDVKVVASIVGHASTQITRDLYQHVVPELHIDAAGRMDEALFGDQT